MRQKKLFAHLKLAETKPPQFNLLNSVGENFDKFKFILIGHIKRFLLY